MAERTSGLDGGTLQRTATERLLDWGFSREDIAATLGHSTAWVRGVQDSTRSDHWPRSTEHRSSSTDNTIRN